jgi:hypothetical protein
MILSFRRLPESGCFFNLGSGVLLAAGAGMECPLISPFEKNANFFCEGWIDAHVHAAIGAAAVVECGVDGPVLRQHGIYQFEIDAN